MKRVLFILLLFLFIVPSAMAAPMEEGTTAASMQKKTVEYTLPYPGLLPDSPLYPLKAARDKLIEFLIADPLKKSEFFILQADKRLQSGVSLVEKKKVSLGQSTISKGQNYFDRAIEKLGQARDQGQAINDLKQKLLLSLKKHEEVLKETEKKLKGNDREQWKTLLSRAQKLEKKAKNIKSTK